MRIPDHYVLQANKTEVGGQRDITVRRYGTTVAFNHPAITKAISDSELVFGKQFGVIKAYETSNPEHGLRALFGQVRERNIILINEETNNLDYFRIKHVLVGTVMVEFLRGADGHIELLVYGGKPQHADLWDLLFRNFGVNPPPWQQYFEPDAVRSLCEKYFKQLIEINIAPFEQDGWETIGAADFKSYRGHFIDSSIQRMKQVKENREIKILAFRSLMEQQQITPMVGTCDVRFSLLKDSGITLEIPNLPLPSMLTEFEVEIAFYDFARQTYGRIIGDRNLYLPTQTYQSQMKLI
jgi:hypothetical protein